MKHFSLHAKSLKGIHYGATLRPSRDWLLLIAFSFVCLLASVGWNLWTFTKVTRGQSFEASITTQETNATAVDTVTKLFEARAIEEARYKSEYRFVDPSMRPR
jgi:hypothetical protein